MFALERILSSIILPAMKFWMSLRQPHCWQRKSLPPRGILLVHNTLAIAHICTGSIARDATLLSENIRCSGLFDLHFLVFIFVFFWSLTFQAYSLMFLNLSEGSHKTALVFATPSVRACV